MGRSCLDCRCGKKKKRITNKNAFVSEFLVGSIMNNIIFTEINGKPIEGYLGDNDNAEILFILKEPNTPDVKSDDGFWFKQVIFDKNRSNSGKRYFNIFGCLAEKILNYNESKFDLLKRCAYINLYPFSGSERISNHYKEVLTAFKNTSLDCRKDINIDKSSTPIEIAENRMSLINQMIVSGKTKYIVTVKDIYDKLSGGDYSNSYFQLEYGRKNQTKSFAFHILSNDVKLCEFWHPSYTWINYHFLEKATCNDLSSK